MPTSTAAQKAKAATASTGSDASPAPAAKTRKPSGPRVTSADAMILEVGEAVSRSEVPREALTKGTRTNPFDALLTKSFEANDEENDKFVPIRTKKDVVDKQVALIRSAANYLEIGSRILKPQDNGDGTVTLFFRAQDKQKRSKKDETATTGE